MGSCVPSPQGGEGQDEGAQVVPIETLTPPYPSLSPLGRGFGGAERRAPDMASQSQS
jgi:hypothetical protein